MKPDRTPVAPGTTTSLDRTLDAFCWLCLFAALALGTWARLRGLGSAPLAVDEYYLLRSVENVLANGIPAYDTGGYYPRGLLHQYATALLLHIGLPGEELAIRLPSALSGFAAIYGAYLLTRHLGGHRVALLAASLLCVSLWQVEFSRFGRMYAMFQACSVFFLLAAARYLESGERRYWRQMTALAVLTVFVHEGAVLLAAGAVLATLVTEKSRNWRRSVFAACGLGAVVTFLSIPWREIGSLQPAVGATGRKSLDDELNWGAEFWQLGGLTPDVSAGVVGAILGVIVAWGLWRAYDGCRGSEEPPARWLVAASWLVICTTTAGGFMLGGALILIVALLLGVFSAAPLRDAEFMKVAVRRFAWIGLLSFSVIVVGAVAATESSFPRAIIGGAKSALRVPDLYGAVALPWLNALPNLFTVLAITIAWASYLAVFEQAREISRVRYRQLAGLVLVLLALTALVIGSAGSTRYTFFLYPALVALWLTGILIIIRQQFSGSTAALAAAIVIGGTFMVSHDFRVAHLREIDTPQFQYRLSYDESLVRHFYMRWDYRGLAQTLDRLAEESDYVVSAAYPVFNHYSQLVDAAYVDDQTSVFHNIAVRGGTVDRWSNLPLLHNFDQLEAAIAGHPGRSWLVVRTDKFKWLTPSERQILLRYGKEFVATSQDGFLALIEVPPSAGRE